MPTTTLESRIHHHRTGPAYWGFVFAGLAWTLLTGFSLFWNENSLRDAQIDLATKEARALWNKDAAFRQWASSHGGVYVQPDEHTPPNPYLAHLSKRDVVTTDGMRLTLMNPAYMMRQMTQYFGDSYGIKGKITGRKQLNPINRPDPWESKGLGLFEQGADEFTEQAIIDGKPYLRLMKPMYMTEGCVKCHGILGYRDGDLRGGVSVSIPLENYFNSIEGTLNDMRITHGVVWLIGMLVIVSLGVLARWRHRHRLQLLDQLRHDALFDKLTGLPNRNLLLERLQHALEGTSRPHDQGLAVLFIDLDRFKRINDSYGHSTGDQVLQEVARRIVQHVRPSDTVARISGDEFVCLLENIDDLNQCVYVAERISEGISQEIQLEQLTLALDCSIGICLHDPDYSSAEEMIRDADTAMYRAKNMGRGGIDIFNPEMRQSVVELTTLEHGIRAALQKNELSLHYQPVVDSGKGEIAGFEALLRWNHPTLGPVPPDKFIPIAEETGAIHAIGEWVLQQACRQVSLWNRTAGEESRFFISVNLSAQQVMQPAVIDSVREALAMAQLPPSSLHCEVTETTLVSDTGAGKAHLEALRDLGVHLSADDFGKGYCSLTYLQEFEFDILKIDKQFVQDMGAGGRGLKLVKTLLLLAQDLDMSVVAEGIETDDQLNRLQSMRCQFMQGYLLCRPVPTADIDKLLKHNAHNDINLLRAMNQPENNVTSSRPSGKPSAGTGRYAG